MKLQPVNEQKHGDLDIAIATGCPYSGWQSALPALLQLGFEESGGTFDDWFDELLQGAGIIDPLQVNQPLRPDHEQTEKAIALFSSEPVSSVLWANDRSLWLLDFWAANFPQVRFILLYARAENAMFYALRRGMEAERFMEVWQTANRQLLSFQRRNRRRSLLIDAEAAAKHPDKLADVCQRIGLALGPVTPVASLQVGAPALERLLADQYISKQPAILALQMELEASSQPLGEAIAHETPNFAELFKDYRQWQMRIEHLAVEGEKQVKRATEQQAQLLQAREAREDLEVAKQKIEQENELLLAQLQQIQTELETKFLEKQRIEQDHNAQETQLGRLKIEMDEAKERLQADENKWKELTGEQQRLQAQVSQATNVRENLQAAKQEVEQENELLLLQLHQVQEELEHYFLQYQELVQVSESVKKSEEASDSGNQQKQHELEDASSVRQVKFIASLRAGVNLFRRKSQAEKMEIRQIRLLKESSLFDEAWYLEQYSDVAESGVEPVKHYLRYGAAEGRNPSTQFDTVFYLAVNPDVASANINPLIHYIRFGKDEGRSPTT